MRVTKLLMAVLVIIPLSFSNADSVIQTDWSGGDGILGPVLDWGNEFYQSSNINWSDYPGILLLSKGILEHTIDGDYDRAWSVYSEDVDGDGDMDVLGAAWEADDITWWENSDTSPGIYWVKHTVDGDFDGARFVYSEDIDGDGDMDILGTALYADDIAWWENDDGSGTSWTEHTVDGNFDGAHSVYSEDINGDGDMDILGTAIYADDITWWQNDNGSGTAWIKYTVDGSFDGAHSVYSEDINGDGYMDVLGAAVYDDDITWWENVDGTGTSWVEHIVDGSFDGAVYVYSEDIDGDGDMDVLGTAHDANDIAWWENVDGSGISWTEHTIDGDFSGAISVYSEDMDSDGDMDILGTAIYADEITWWENIDGSGTSLIEHTVDGSFDGAVSVYSEDIDGDGNMDVLGAAEIADDITWWRLETYSPEGSLESSIFDTQGSPQWTSIDWNCSEPAETDLYFQYKTSDDPGSMGVWSDPIYEPCLLSGLLDRYFQYKVSMETDDPDFTPVLQDLTLNWDPLGVGDDPQVTEYLLFGAEPNPASGSVSIGFAVPELSPVEFYIFDLSGRLVSEIHGDEYSQGFHDVLLGDFSPGIYFCRMISGDFTATQRFVVIE